MNLYTWEHDGNYERYARRTSDPRVVALVVRDTHDAMPPDGDMYAPAAYVSGRYEWRCKGAGDVFHDHDIYAAYADALNRWGQGETAERYMRIFHGVREIRHVRSRVWQGGGEVVIFDTPAWREHVGIEPQPWRVTSATGPGRGFRETRHDGTLTEVEARRAHLAEVAGPHDDDDNRLTPAEDDSDRRIVTSCGRTSVLGGDVETWQAYLDGDVYGVGALVNPEHTIWGEDEDTPLDEDGDWIEAPNGMCWGYYGDDWATQAALDAAEDASGALPELLPWEVAQ